MSAILKGGGMSRHGETVKMERDMPAGVTEDQQVPKTMVNHEDYSSAHLSLESLVITLCNYADSSNSEGGDMKKTGLTTAEVITYLQTLANTCAELRRVGVEAGLMLFEGDSKVWCCGSSRLKHLATHPQMTHVLSEMTSTEAEEQMSLKSWTVVTLNHHRHSPSSRSENHSFPASSSNHAKCSCAGEDSDGVSYPSLSGFHTLMETNSSSGSVRDSGRSVEEKVAVNEPFTLSSDSKNVPQTIKPSIKGEPPTSTSESEPLTSASESEPPCAGESEQTLRFSGNGKTTILTHASKDDPLTLTCASEGEGQDIMSQEEEEEDVSDDVSVRSDELSALDIRGGNGSSDRKALYSSKEWQTKMVGHILAKAPQPSEPPQTSTGSDSTVPGVGLDHSLPEAGGDTLTDKQWQEMMVRRILESVPQEPQPLKTPTSHSNPVLGTTIDSSTDIPTTITTPATTTTPTTTSIFNFATTITSTTNDISSPTTSTSNGSPSTSTMESDVPFCSQSSSLTDTQPCKAAGGDTLTDKQWQEMMVRRILESVPQEPQALRAPIPTSHSTPVLGTTIDSSTDIHTSIISSPTHVPIITTTTSIFNFPTTITSTTNDISSPTTSTSIGSPSTSTMESDVPFSSQSSSLTDTQPCKPASSGSSQLSKEWQKMMVSCITDGCLTAQDTVPPTPKSIPRPAPRPAAKLDLTSAVADILSSDPDQLAQVSSLPRTRKKNWCGVCETSFASKPELERHRVEMHPPGSKPFPCTMCPKCFGSKHLLDLHLRRHMGVKPYQCEQCGFRCSEKVNLQVHMRIHSGEKPFPCDICGRHFRARSACKVHRLQHTGENPHLCEFCGKGFRNKGWLDEHRRKHSGEVPFACTYCGKAFISNRLLKIHKRIHTGIEPHTCRYCGKAFKFSNHLNVHLRLHTGERPFCCEICGSSFHRSDLLAAHVRKHYPSADKKNRQPSSTHSKEGQSLL